MTRARYDLGGDLPGSWIIATLQARELVLTQAETQVAWETWQQQRLDADSTDS